MNWRLANSLVTLRAELNQEYPTRPKGSDGTIGDARHQAEHSDHNPDKYGVVQAFDITAAPFSDALCAGLVRMLRAGDKRIKYVIWQRMIYTVSRPQGYAYTGEDPHVSHIHLSVSDDPAEFDREDPWLWQGTPHADRLFNLYRVKDGDTALSIATKFHVPIALIEGDNSGILFTAGTVIRIRKQDEIK